MIFHIFRFICYRNSIQSSEDPLAQDRECVCVCVCGAGGGVLFTAGFVRTRALPVFTPGSTVLIFRRNFLPPFLLNWFRWIHPKLGSSKFLRNARKSSLKYTLWEHTHHLVITAGVSKQDSVTYLCHLRLKRQYSPAIFDIYEKKNL
jgi:hypothetical protein